ncbi:MAG: hypothetical protein AAGF73_13470 [Actinomycetota bacterium]
MSDRNQKYRDNVAAACSQHIGDEIIAIGIFSPRGTAGAVGMIEGASPLLGTLMRRRAKSNAGGVPQTAVYALTANALHVLDGTPKAKSWKIKKHVAAWPRTSFTARPVAGSVTDQVELTFDDGATIGLESIKFGAQGFNGEIIDHLTQSAATG